MGSRPWLQWRPSQESAPQSKTKSYAPGHGWYLDEPIVPFALFSELWGEGQAGQGDGQRQGSGPGGAATCLPRGGSGHRGLRSGGWAELHDILASPPGLRLAGAATGEVGEDADFLIAKEFVRTVKTTNDVAERGVKLISAYAAILTTDEKQRQWLLQGVEQCRKRYATCKKCTLNCTYAWAVSGDPHYLRIALSVRFGVILPS